ncbi:MAG: acyltransferase family protein [Bacteroides sp.]|nr:acyltransferase family protein [Alistipes timonensis]MCM1311165.1 acyltransferase family protein [Bacteroides sp.]MCM1405578.1 acyltransferase family protein [[Clostridium] fimetarium]
MSDRIKHIDTAKGIGMMLIIASHIWTTTGFQSTSIFSGWDSSLNSFYVPLFFLLSGIFEPNESNRSKYVKRLLSLFKLLPVFAFTGILAVGLIQNKWGLSSCFKGSLTWFIVTLIWISAIFGIIKNLRYGYVYVIVIMAAGIWLSNTGHSYLYLGQAALNLPFYAIGFYLKKHLVNSNFNWIVCASTFLVWVATVLIFFKSPQNLSLNLVSQPYAAFYIEAIAGSLLVIELSKLASTSFIAWFGRNTLTPMLLQMAFIMLIGRYILADNILQYALIALIVIMLCAVCVPLLQNKHFNIFKWRVSLK